MHDSKYFKILYFTSFFLNIAYAAKATSLDVELGAGGMTQPSSQYIHTVYNTSISYKFLSNISIKGFVWQRPIFQSSGFQDQDTGFHVMLGYHMDMKAKVDLSIHAGVGEVDGWVQRDSDHLRTSFHVFGSTTSVSVKKNFGSLWVALQHLLFTGRRSQLEIDAKVLWPFSVTSLQAGIHL